MPANDDNHDDDDEDDNDDDDDENGIQPIHSKSNQHVIGGCEAEGLHELEKRKRHLLKYSNVLFLLIHFCLRSHELKEKKAPLKVPPICFFLFIHF